MSEWDVVSTAPASTAAAGGDWSVVSRAPASALNAKTMGAAVGAVANIANRDWQGAKAGFASGVNDVMRSAVDPVASWLQQHVPLPESVQSLGGLLNTTAAANSGHVAATKRLADQNAGAPTFGPGRMAGQVAGVAPFMAAGGEVLAPLKSAPVVGPVMRFLGGEGALASKVASGVLQGASGAALTNQANPETPVIEQMVVGGLMGGALPAAGALAGKTGEAIGQIASSLSPTKFVRPLTKEGQQQIVGRLLSDAAGGPAAMGTPPLPGMQLSPGQQSGNQGLLWLERGQEQANPAINSAFASQKIANNSALRGAIGQVGDLTSNAPAAIEARLEAAQTASKNATRALWRAAGVDEQTSIPTNWLRARTGDYLNGLKVAERKVIGSDLTSTLDELPDHTNLGEIQAWRADIGDKVRAAFRAGENNKARILGGLQSVVSDFTDELPMMGSNKPTPEAMAAYNAARQATRQMKETFTQPAPIRNALGLDRFGADKVPTSAMADQFVRTGKGAPEAFQSYLKAAGNDPEALQAARDAFAQKFMDAAETTQTNVAGDRQLSTAKIRSFTDNYQHVINSSLFTPKQQVFIKSIADAADMASRRANAAPPGGSDTAAKLAASLFTDKTYLQALLGPKTVGAMDAASTMGGLMLGHGNPLVSPLTAGGAYFGERKLLGAVYSAPREKVMELLTQAMTDPELAKTLMMKATPASEAMIRPVVRQKLLSILGSVPTYATTIPARDALTPSPAYAQ